MTEARPILSNARAYLPTTQNSNEVQQKKAPAPLYFGGDEVDEVILSNQEEEQKAQKKKTYTIVGAVLGTIALAAAAFVGLSATGCTNKGADSLKGFTQLTRGEGESAKKMATIAKTDKSWTGATWGGVAETIKTTLKDSNNKFNKIVIVATDDNKKKLEEKLGKDLLDKFNEKLIFRAENDITNVVSTYGADEKALILVDSSKDDWFDQIKTKIETPDDNNSSSTADQNAAKPVDQNAGQQGGAQPNPPTKDPNAGQQGGAQPNPPTKDPNAEQANGAQPNPPTKDPNAGQQGGAQPNPPTKDPNAEQANGAQPNPPTKDPNAGQQGGAQPNPPTKDPNAEQANGAQPNPPTKDPNAGQQGGAQPNPPTKDPNAGQQGGAQPNPPTKDPNAEQANGAQPNPPTKDPNAEQGNGAQGGVDQNAQANGAQVQVINLGDKELQPVNSLAELKKDKYVIINNSDNIITFDDHNEDIIKINKKTYTRTKQKNLNINLNDLSVKNKKIVAMDNNGAMYVIQKHRKEFQVYSLTNQQPQTL